MNKPVTATAYLVIEGERWRYSSADPLTGLKPVSKAKVAAVRQSRPKSLDIDQIVVKVTIQLPAGAFDPIAPQALIIVPEEMIMNDVEVVAVADEEMMQ